MTDKNLTRRDFIKKVGLLGAAVGFPSIIPASALGKNGFVSPSNRITMGSIGLGGMGSGNTRGFLDRRSVQVVALCDPCRKINKYGYGHNETRGWEPMKADVDKKYSERFGSDYKGCDIYEDFRDLIARKDIDAITTATPDHWHALIAVAAVRSGKDVYGEKPLTRRVEEGRILANAVREYGRVWQTGSWQRSASHFLRVAELVRNGYIGKVHTVKIGLPANNYLAKVPAEPIPENFNWDLWLGPAPRAEYSHHRAFTTWRFISDYSSGKIGDWGAHHIDTMHWALGYDMSGPVSIKPTKIEWPKDGLFDHPVHYTMEAKYPNGETVIISDEFKNGIEFFSDKGRMFVDRSYVEADPKTLWKEQIKVGDERLYYSRNHTDNFIDCVKNRRLSSTDIEVAHRSNTVTLLGEIAYRVGREIKWDVKTETIANDKQASELLRAVYRAPWVL